ncbi:protein adenylyltransferase SelO [Undibacterium danionis]|uniref:Protein nucleotidyltransferase YdiU n=1 Tax=Undibacterium danionis TaxID=1812100 RepID=A0ABV6IJW8_9BURK
MSNSDTRTMSPLRFHKRFASLGSTFYTELQPSPIKSPYLIATSPPMLAEFNLSAEQMQTQEMIEIFSGNRTAPDSKPLAAVYSGHQFGVWAGQLGDGRAILLGELASKRKDVLHEIQLKGAGMTPYSRMGDGRAVLRSSIREFLCSEAMAGLGIPTTRALCLTGSDQYTMREMPEKTAIVTRTAPSFIRFGSFEHWYYNNQAEPLQQLADFVIQHYYPDLAQTDNPYQALLRAVVNKTADLVAQWQSVGFMHGVLNTDNMSILGLTLDYGPFGFMDGYDPAHICNHSDHQGRYSYQMQPRIGQWNCHALAQALLPLIGEVDSAQEALSCYTEQFERSYDRLMHAKFGLTTFMPEDQDIFNEYLELMAEAKTDFTIAFRQLGRLQIADQQNDHFLRDLFINRERLDQWLVNYRQRLQLENSQDLERQTSMNLTNPKYVLRNYLAQQAIERAEQKDFSEIHKLLSILAKPYDEQIEHEQYAQLPPDWATTLSVSCSS